MQIIRAARIAKKAVRFVLLLMMVYVGLLIVVDVALEVLYQIRL